MGAKKPPNGGKITELRKERGLKQADLADKTNISVRRLRDIERKNLPVPTTDITGIAAVLKVDPGQITLSTPDASPTKAALPTKAGSLLKLRAVQSATELSALAEVDKYEWGLKIDPTPATADDMQRVMVIVDRLIAGISLGWDGFEYGRDEFDSQPFGEIPRLAWLQELLTKLRTNGVNILAGTYTRSQLRKLEKGEILGPNETEVRARGGTVEQVYTTKLVLKISFVPSDVEEEVVQIYTGPSMKHLEIVHGDDLPF
jgi:transcriptional regulator with XRE-family HTH domain